MPERKAIENTRTDTALTRHNAKRGTNQNKDKASETGTVFLVDFDRVLRLALEFRFHTAVQSFGGAERRNFLHAKSLQGPPALDRINLRSAFARLRDNGIAQDIISQRHKRIQSHPPEVH